MAGHRSPRGRHARPGAIPARTLTTGRPAPGGPSIRTSVIATAAALGAVATGTLTSLVPVLEGSGVAPTADATEDSLTTTLAANSAPLAAESLPAEPARNAAGPLFLPVALPLAAETTDGEAAADPHLALLDKAAGIAAQIADLHAKEQRKQADNARINALIDQGGLDGWIAEALRILDLPQSLAPSVKRIIMAESGGNPRAINTWDSNAARGTPSQGLMQTIPPTYKKFVHPDMSGRPITDPVANITAGIRYMIANYGLDTLQDGGRRSSSGSYVGY